MERKHLEIDLSALRHNYRVVSDLAGPETRIVAVVKADAYGHGLVPVSRALADCGAHALGIFRPDDAADMRRAGLNITVIALSGIFPWEAQTAAAHNVSVVLFTMDMARSFSQACLERGTTGDALVKVDTGMGRLGIFPQDLPAFLAALAPLKGIRVTGIASHLAASELPENAHTAGQTEVFAQISRPMAQDNLANSGAILEGLAKGYPMARPGIALYGSAPDPGMKGAALLRPVMSFKTRVLCVKDLPKGSPVGYGMTYVTPGPSRIATLPVGYADGYFRRLSNKGVALVHGRRVPVVGSVCMNLTMLDVTGLEGVEPGDEAVLLGSQGSERVTGDELADWAGTISYEFYCSLGRANPRRYLE